MEKGQLRCDANVSVRLKGAPEFGTKAEVKNLNSFRFAKMAVDYEIARQVAVLESGGKIDQETRLYNSETGETVGMRSKEHAHDYRYFPEPDLVPLQVSEAWLSGIREAMVELPREAPEIRDAIFVDAVSGSIADGNASGERVFREGRRGVGRSARDRKLDHHRGSGARRRVRESEAPRPPARWSGRSTRKRSAAKWRKTFSPRCMRRQVGRGDHRERGTAADQRHRRARKDRRGSAGGEREAGGAVQIGEDDGDRLPGGPSDEGEQGASESGGGE